MALALPSAAAAQEQAPVIVVTGRGLEAARGESVYGVAQIGPDRLGGSASSRLEDVLRDVPGFQLFRRSDARSANPTSQGATLRALGGNASSRALLLLDGVPQTDPFGGWISFPAYDPRRLASARVVRGGGSGAAGPGALAGTIELESAADEGVVVALAGGSRGSVDAFVGAGVALGAGLLTVSGSYAGGDGFVPVVAGQRGPDDRPSPYEQASVALRAAAPVGDEVELQAGGLWFSDGRERGTALSEIATTGLDASVRLVGNGAWRWSALAYLQTRSFANSFASAGAARQVAIRTAEQYEVPSTGLGARVEVRPPLGAVELRVGADWRDTEGATQERYNFQNGVGTRGRVAGGHSRTLGAFAEASWERGPLVLSGGARVDQWTITDGFLFERVFNGVTLTDRAFPDRSGWQPTARGGVAWRIDPAVTVRAASYLGWRLPTLNELYRPFRVGADATAANAALEPERLRGVEVGLAWRPADGAQVSVTAFSNRLEDAIANVSIGGGPGIFDGVGFVAAGGAFRRRDNLRAITSRGVEVDASLQRGPWSLRGGYSFAGARVVAEGAGRPLDGLRPAQTPRHAASATIAWSAEEAAASLTARFVGEQYEDDLNRQLLPSAVTLDASLRLPIGDGIAMEARAENLTDTHVVAAISGDGIVERGTPRTLWLGVRLSR